MGGITMKQLEDNRLPLTKINQICHQTMLNSGSINLGQIIDYGGLLKDTCKSPEQKEQLSALNLEIHRLLKIFKND